MVSPRLAWVRGSAFLLVACLTLVALADWLFYGHPAGWTVGLYIAAVLLSVAVRGGSAGRAWAARLLMLGVLGLALASVEEPGPLTVTLALVGVVTLAMTLRSGWTSRPALWVTRWTIFAFRGSWQFANDIRVKLRRRFRGGAKPWPLFRWVALWALPVALSLVFVGLFWLANPIIEQWMTALRRVLNHFAWNWTKYLGPGRVLMWILVGIWTWGLLRTRPKRVLRHVPNAPLNAIVMPELPEPAKFDEVGLVVRCLALFNVIFAVQTVLDVIYLFGGATLPEGVTLARYAHRGAYPLVATALLAAVFVLFTFRGRGKGPAERSPWARRLVYAWIAQNVFLVLTAAWRLGLYVEAYSLTRWRVATVIWMGLVALGLVWIVVRILTHRDTSWLLKANVLTTVVVLYACCFPNFDGFIARYNAEHCREIDGDGAPIDLAYMRELGVEAIPALEWLEAHAPGSNVGGEAAYDAAALRRELENELIDWRGWTWRRGRLNETARSSEVESTLAGR